jgi:hypothetical protein
MAHIAGMVAAAWRRTSPAAMPGSAAEATRPMTVPAISSATAGATNAMIALLARYFVRLSEPASTGSTRWSTYSA